MKRLELRFCSGLFRVTVGLDLMKQEIGFQHNCTQQLIHAFQKRGCVPPDLFEASIGCFPTVASSFLSSSRPIVTQP